MMFGTDPDEGFTFRVARDLFVLTTGVGSPPQAFWDQYCDALRKPAAAGPVRILIDARAGQRRPEPMQRQQLEDAVPATMVRAAVVSDNRLVRMVTKVFTWVGYDTRGFTAAEIEEAVNYLDCSEGERKWVQAIVGLRQGRDGRP